jgi:hypothetical protein
MANTRLAVTVGATVSLHGYFPGAKRVYMRDFNRKVRAYNKRLVAALAWDTEDLDPGCGCDFCNPPTCYGYGNGCDCKDCADYHAYLFCNNISLPDWQWNRMDTDRFGFPTTQIEDFIGTF